MAVYDPSDDEMEEERRLCYVGITRAMKNLTLTCARQRMRNGEPNFNFPSRFISEIPRYLIQQSGGVEKSIPAPKTVSIKPAGLDDIFSPAKKYNKGSKNPFANNPYIKKGAASLSSPGEKPDYEEGDTVYHIKFGTGIVQSISRRGNYAVHLQNL